MRKLALFSLASVLWLVSGGVALADGMLLPVPEGLSSDYLVVRYHHVTVRIEDGHAVTRVEQEFYNPREVPVAGRYLFPVPPEAMLSHFEATVDGQRQPAIRQDAATTNAELVALVAQQRDPSLLQYADWESLAFDLSLLPGESRRMALEYEQVLVPSAGLYRYRYVLSTERYSSLPVEEIALSVDLRSSRGLSSLYSSSHEVAIERRGPGQAWVRWEARDTNPTEDFELFFAPAEGGFGAGLLTGERNGEDHLLFLFSPEAEPRQGQVLPKDILFVLDRSGSMDGDKIQQARNALHYILGQLGKDDRFCLVGFNDQVSPLHPYLQPVSEDTLREARRYVDQLSAEGDTDLEAALQTGLEILLGTPERGATRIVVFLTDGLPTAGFTDEDLIAHLVTRTNAAANARLHAFGVGYDVNTHLLDRLATDNAGSVTYVRPGENLEVALTEFYGRIAHPLLTDLEVEFEGLEATELYPQAPPDLFQGSSLLLTGRYEAPGSAVSVRVRGLAGGERKEYVYRFDLAETGNHGFVPRLWATRRAGALLDQVRVEGASPALEDEIRELGLSYGIVTPYTTFVIAGQAEGAASADNMDLYNLEEVNQVSGRVTIEARLQNQMYQQASQAGLATGANVTSYGGRSLAQVGTQQVDLSLLQGHEGSDEAIGDKWLARNVAVDRTVEFGSEAYFALAADAEARPYLQSGRNVVFAYKGEVIAITDASAERSEPNGTEGSQQIQTIDPALTPQATWPTGLALLAESSLAVLARLLPFAAMAALLGLITLGLVVWQALKPRSS